MCDHKEGPNPRNVGVCVKCSRPIAPRDREFEMGFLAGTRHAGFAADVAERLEWAQVRYGLRWRGFDFARMLREVNEEGLDLGGWSALAAQHEALDALPDDEKLRARWMLQEIATLGAQVTDLVSLLHGVMGIEVPR